MSVPRVDFPDLMNMVRWEPGEHVSLIGPTGYGKTTIELELLARRRFVVFLATKKRDAILSDLVKSREYRKVEKWPPPGPPLLIPKVILWPKWRNSDDTAAVAETFWQALQDIFGEERWTVAADELAWLCRRYGLGDTFKDFWQQGRSMQLSLLGATQRPAWVPLDLYTEPTHMFLFKATEATAVKRIQELSGSDTKTIRQVVRSLRKYEFLYVNRATDELYVSKTPDPNL